MSKIIDLVNKLYFEYKNKTRSDGLIKKDIIKLIEKNPIASLKLGHIVNIKPTYISYTQYIITPLVDYE